MNTLIAGIFSFALLAFMIYLFFLAIRLVKAVEKIADQLEKK
jgi:hypothetical protein